MCLMLDVNSHSRHRMSPKSICSVIKGFTTIRGDGPIGANLSCLASSSCAGLTPRIHLLREKVLTKIDGLPGLRIPEQAAHDSGMMPPTHSEIIPPTVP